MERLKKCWHILILFLILVLTGFLTFYQVGNEGFSNTYYSAAVRSMMTSWHNFFFASFDPGGFVSVDKPALGLWLQVLSAWIFGFHGWSLILPEALSAVISTLIVYHLAKRSFDRSAGLLSALIFSVTPILIAVSRTNNLDSSLVMVLLFAAWALIIATEKGSLKHLMLGMALVGIGFNIKMLEAFMVLPGFYLAYLAASKLKTGKKIVHLAVATAVLLAISLSWALAVDLTPADQRPYVGSSGNNSELGLALGYNGIERITGMNFGSSAGTSGAANGFQNRDGISGQLPDGQFPGNDGSANRPFDRQMPDGGVFGGSNGGSGSGDGTVNMQPPANDGSGNGIPDGGNNRFFGGNRSDGGRQRMDDGFGGMGGGPGSESENGPKGVLRIFNRELAGQIGWLIPMAFFGAVMLFLRMRDRYNPERDAAKIYFLLWAGCLIPMIAFFSFAGFFHRYYLSMMAPGIAILAGVGIIEMWKAYRDRDWKWIILPASILASVALQCVILLRYSGWSDILTPVIIVAGLASSVSLAVIRLMNRDNLNKTIKVALGAGILALLIAPAAWSLTPILYGSQATLPFAGPELERENGFGGFMNSPAASLGGMPNKSFRSGRDGVSEDIVTFLLRQKKDEKYLVAVSSANEAAPIIIETGQPVMALGGFSGSDNILTVDELKNMVQAGEVRYFLVGGFGGMGRQGELTNWIIQNGTAVDGMQGLYDLSALSASPSESGFL